MGFITIIPVENTFLRVFDKPLKIRLNKKVIDFNYAHLSPFNNGGHLSFQANDKIYVWYLDAPLEGKNAVQIPEGYLLYRFFKERQNAILLLPRKDSLIALVICQGELRAQVTLQDSIHQDHSIDLLKREYSLVNPELIRLEPTARIAVKPADLLAFAHTDLKPAELLEKAVALAKGPMIAALLITAGFTLYQQTRLESVSAEKRGYLSRLKQGNAPLLSSLDRVREQSGYWQEFIAREQAYPDFYLLLAQLAEVVKRNGGYLNSVDFSDNHITVWAGLKSSEASIIKGLLATNLFLEVKLLNSTRDSIKPDYNLYNLAITLRPRQKGAVL
jgi:hypothetical protein